MRSAMSLAALVVLLASQLVAQQSPTTNQTQPKDPTYRAPAAPNTPDANQRPGTFSDATARPQQGQQRILRASKVIGTTVKNKASEELGSINDIVLDPRDGRVLYAAVSMGGFLGVGDKLFAVPWDALECREENGKHVAYLDIDKKRLEHAQGFDQENWPDMASEKWRTENDRPYRSQRYQGHELLKPVQPSVGQPGVLPGTQPRPAQPSSGSQPERRQ